MFKGLKTYTGGAILTIIALLNLLGIDSSPEEVSEGVNAISTALEALATAAGMFLTFYGRYKATK